MPITHGGDWAGYQLEFGGQPLDFSANVSPLGLPEGVRQAVVDALPHADRYPDPLCRELTDRLAVHHGVSPEWILCGNGAADLIFRLVAALRPRRAMVTAPTFGEYEGALRLHDCEVLYHTLREEDDFAVTASILEAITPGLDLLFLCEPNNPTGRTTPRPLLLEILKQCADCGTLLVVDECFNELLDDPTAHTLMGELAGNKNLLLLKAFTKCYAMAGLRLGYLLCSDNELIAKTSAAGQPWAVSSLAQAAGAAALQETAYLERLHRLITEQRPRLAAGLAALGCTVCNGEANYLLLHCNDTQLAVKLRRRGVLIRECGNYHGLDSGWYRVAVRTEGENNRLLQEIREVL